MLDFVSCVLLHQTILEINRNFINSNYLDKNEVTA